MDHLGLKRRDLDTYHDYLLGPHDFDIRIDLLHLDESPIGSARGQFIDGQVNFQRSGSVKRTATLTLNDPDHSLHLDTGSPFAGAMFADRLVRVRHRVTVPDVGPVVATVFVGSIARLTRTGDELALECQDKSALANRGSRPYTVKKGRNAVDAIHDVMHDCTGERHFRLPAGTKTRLPRSFNVGWRDEASPWAVCQKIAALLNMELIYSCDGYLTLRHRPKHAVVRLPESALTAPPAGSYDLTQVSNYVRVTGEHAKATKKHKAIAIGAIARPKARHPLSPEALDRNGSPGFRPLVIDDSGIRRDSVANQRANRELDKHLPMSATSSVQGVPFFHLDYGDPVKVVTDWGDAVLNLEECSIPLGLAGDASWGEQRLVHKPRRRR